MRTLWNPFYSQYLICWWIYTFTSNSLVGKIILGSLGTSENGLLKWVKELSYVLWITLTMWYWWIWIPKIIKILFERKWMICRWDCTLKTLLVMIIARSLWTASWRINSIIIWDRWWIETEDEWRKWEHICFNSNDDFLLIDGGFKVRKLWVKEQTEISW